MKRVLVIVTGTAVLGGCIGDGSLTGPVREALECRLPVSPVQALAVVDIPVAELVEATRDVVDRLVPALPEGTERDRLATALDHLARNVAGASASGNQICLATMAADRALRAVEKPDAHAADRAAIRLVVDVLAAHIAVTGGDGALVDQGQALWQ